jgi:hypothetical protein
MTDTKDEIVENETVPSLSVEKQVEQFSNPKEEEETPNKNTSLSVEQQVAQLPVPPLPETLDNVPGIRFVDYPDESQLDAVMNLVGRDLSEPYSSKLSHSYQISGSVIL